MSRRLKCLSALHALGWVVVVPLLGAALLDPFVTFEKWPQSLLEGRDVTGARLAQPGPEAVSGSGDGGVRRTRREVVAVASASVTAPARPVAAGAVAAGGPVTDSGAPAPLTRDLDRAIRRGRGGSRTSGQVPTGPGAVVPPSTGEVPLSPAAPTPTAAPERRVPDPGPAAPAAGGSGVVAAPVVSPEPEVPVVDSRGGPDTPRPPAAPPAVRPDADPAEPPPAPEPEVPAEEEPPAVETPPAAEEPPPAAPPAVENPSPGPEGPGLGPEDPGAPDPGAPPAEPEPTPALTPPASEELEAEEPAETE